MADRDLEVAQEMDLAPPSPSGTAGPAPRAGQASATLAAKLAELKARVGQLPQRPATPELKYQLPLWEELARAIPNHLARSSLFAPIARGTRKRHGDTEIASRSDVRILFSGDQLDEADCDVWMQALHEARRVPLGQPVAINRAEFLRQIGRAKSAAAYEWLHKSFKRLAFGMLAIETKKYSIGIGGRGRVLHLIDGFDHNADTDSYELRIDPRVMALFSNREFALIDWQKRLQIVNQTDMAKFLQRLVATSNDVVQRYAIEDLKVRMQYGGRMRDFKVALLAALQELERLEIVAGPRLELSTRGKEQAAWTRLELVK